MTGHGLDPYGPGVRWQVWEVNPATRAVYRIAGANTEADVDELVATYHGHGRDADVRDLTVPYADPAAWDRRPRPRPATTPAPPAHRYRLREYLNGRLCASSYHDDARTMAPCPAPGFTHDLTDCATWQVLDGVTVDDLRTATPNR